MCRCWGCKFLPCPLFSLAPRQILRRHFPLRRSRTQRRFFLARRPPRTYRRSLSYIYPCRSVVAEITLWNRGAQGVSLLFDLDAAHLYRSPHPQANCSDLRKTLLEPLLPCGICRFQLRGAAMSSPCAAKQVYSAEICASFIFGCFSFSVVFPYKHGRLSGANRMLLVFSGLDDGGLGADRLSSALVNSVAS